VTIAQALPRIHLNRYANVVTPEYARIVPFIFVCCEWRREVAGAGRVVDGSEKSAIMEDLPDVSVALTHPS
jgi:hypothetical protein